MPLSPVLPVAGSNVSGTDAGVFRVVVHGSDPEFAPQAHQRRPGRTISRRSRCRGRQSAVSLTTGGGSAGCSDRTHAAAPANPNASQRRRGCTSRRAPPRPMGSEAGPGPWRSWLSASMARCSTATAGRRWERPGWVDVGDCRLRGEARPRDRCRVGVFPVPSTGLHPAIVVCDSGAELRRFHPDCEARPRDCRDDGRAGAAHRRRWCPAKPVRRQRPALLPPRPQGRDRCCHHDRVNSPA